MRTSCVNRNTFNHTGFLPQLLSLIWELQRQVRNSRRDDFPTSEPFITGDDFRFLSDFVFDDGGLTFLPSQVFSNALVFVKAYPPLLDYFFRQIHPRIRHPYRLLTHNEDRPMPGGQEHWLQDAKLLHWYSTNISCRHPKVTSIPIGILNQRANPENHRNLGELMNATAEKQDRAYLNFHIGDATERAAYNANRQEVYDRFRDCPWVTVSGRVPPRQYLEEISGHRFVISPPGHGPDCYRHWEAMYLGSIPVVERCVNMACYSNYPMILIDDWSQVSPEFLEAEAAKIEQRNFNREQLLFEYWKDLISSCR